MASLAQPTLLGYGLPLPGTIAEHSSGEEGHTGMAPLMEAKQTIDRSPAPPSRAGGVAVGVPSPCRAFRKLSTSMMSAATSRSHIDRWRDRDETVIIFDWDDTLCPTTAGGGADAETLQRHVKVVERVLRLASTWAHVEIVTMAARSWVEYSAVHMLPGIGRVLEELEIPIAYARENVTDRCRRESCREDRDPSLYLKRRTISKVLKGFYRSVTRRQSQDEKRGRSWKNVLSIGDSTAERFAVQDVVMGHVQRDRRGRWKECRCKALKMMEDPTVEELTAQLYRVADLLPVLVQHDGDLDVDLNDQEDLEQKLETSD